MRKVKYVGQMDGIILMLEGNPIIVNNGDQVDVPDDFSNTNFEDVVVEKVTATKTSKQGDVN
jgi:hypothetical protein